MGDRVILHSDLNSFYASVEMMLDPSLRGKAVAVCGSTEDRHGIVLAKSDLAKKAGIKTGMVNWEARQPIRNISSNKQIKPRVFDALIEGEEVYIEVKQAKERELISLCDVLAQIEAAKRQAASGS